MILKETLRQIVKSQRKELESFSYGVEREELGEIKPNMHYALILSGIRRCGKSTLLHQLLKKLPNFYYLNFEDTRLDGFQVGDFEKLDEIFKEDYSESEYYLFDEIQNIDKWELFVRSKLDKQKKFIITGSNASLLSKELGTRLTGRHIDMELFPFSFAESLSMVKAKASATSFSEYLRSGGFPEYLRYKKQEILRELLTDIIQRDIVVRHKLRDSKTVKTLALYLLSNTGSEFSYNNLKKMFNLGSVNTAIAFVSYFEDSYLLFTVPKFDYSLKKQIVNAKKVYSIDNVFITNEHYCSLLKNKYFSKCGPYAIRPLFQFPYTYKLLSSIHFQTGFAIICFPSISNLSSWSNVSINPSTKSNFFIASRSPSNSLCLFPSFSSYETCIAIFILFCSFTKKSHSPFPLK